MRVHAELYYLNLNILKLPVWFVLLLITTNLCDGSGWRLVVSRDASMHCLEIRVRIFSLNISRGNLGLVVTSTH